MGYIVIIEIVVLFTILIVVGVVWMTEALSKIKKREECQNVRDKIEPILPKIKYVNRDVKCEHTNKEWVEFFGGYDGISMWVCKDCGMWFDRWSDLPIVVQYSTLEQYTQPMFLLSDGSMSRFSERWKNPLHKWRTLNRIRYQDFRF